MIFKHSKNYNCLPLTISVMILAHVHVRCMLSPVRLSVVRLSVVCL